MTYVIFVAEFFAACVVAVFWGYLVVRVAIRIISGIETWILGWRRRKPVDLPLIIQNPFFDPDRDARQFIHRRDLADAKRRYEQGIEFP